MTPQETQAFTAFWDHIRRAEEDVRQNWYRGHPTPDAIGDPWDDDFAVAYDAVHLALGPFVRTRMVIVPHDIPLVNAYSADTWHQALMFFLNPPHHIYGSEKAFKSPEYLRIKDGALRELRILESLDEYLDDKVLQADAPSKPKLGKSERIQEELRKLRMAIFGYHFPIGKPAVLTPLTVQQIVDLLPELGWLQPTASRRLALVFKGGTKGYWRWCKRPKPFTGGYDARTGEQIAVFEDTDEEDADEEA
jgi:hypothetical protein